MIKSVLLILFLPFITTSFIYKKAEADTGYIRIEYLGEHSKPYPVVIFYLPNSIDTAYEQFYIYKIATDAGEFEEMQKGINVQDKNDTSLMPNPCSFTVVKNGKGKVIFNRYKNSVKSVFKEITSVFKDSVKQKSVNECLNNLLSRLPG